MTTNFKKISVVARRPELLQVTIFHTGKIAFNAKFVRAIFTGVQYPYVVLFYDSVDKQLGISLAKSSDEYALKVAMSMNKKTQAIVSYAVAAARCLQAMQIDYSQTKRYVVRHDEQEDLWVCQL